MLRLMQDGYSNNGATSNTAEYSFADEGLMMNSTQNENLQAVESGLDHQSPYHKIHTVTGGYGGVRTAIPGFATTATTKLVTRNQGGVPITTALNGSKFSTISNSLFSSFSEIQKMITQLNNIPRYEMAEFIDQTPPKDRRHPAFYRAMAAKYRVADSTHRQYFGIVKRMCVFWL